MQNYPVVSPSSQHTYPIASPSSQQMHAVADSSHISYPVNGKSSHSSCSIAGPSSHHSYPVAGPSTQHIYPVAGSSSQHSYPIAGLSSQQSFTATNTTNNSDESLQKNTVVANVVSAPHQRFHSVNQHCGFQGLPEQRDCVVPAVVGLHSERQSPMLTSQGIIKYFHIVCYVKK
jgi:hypothetical protein